MKHLLLFFLFSGSLGSFSRVVDTTQPLRQFDANSWVAKAAGSMGDVVKRDTPITPDTLRAIILVTMCRKCAAEAIPGYVVISDGKRPVYLDCRKRALKPPQVGWGYEIVDTNYKK